MTYRTPRIKLQLEPLVIRSIIENSGMGHDAIAQKLKVDRRRVDGWANTGEIEYSEVRALAECVKMSETQFLTTIPLESEGLPDYRMMRNAPDRLDAGDLPTVRRVRYMQSVAGEMMDVGGIAARPDIPAGVTVGASAEKVARTERARLAVAGNPDGPVEGSARSMYGMLREAIEGLNIFVFQYPLATEGVCGLSLSDTDPCAILVNSKDTNQAKAFTLLHEYGHILLGMGGVCDEHGVARPDSDKKRAEAWCNRFAASFLMPEAEFAAERKRLEGASSGPFEIVEGLAKRFKVSRYAAAVKAADLAGGGHRAVYGGVLNGMAGRYSRRDDPKDEDEKKGGPGYLVVLISRMGRKFIRLAVSSHDKGVITALDLGDYLDIDLKHLDGLCKKVKMAE